MKENKLQKFKSWKKNLLIFIVTIIIPVLFFLIIELALNIGGYGVSSDFFKKRKINEKKYYTDNIRFSWRFFPPKLARAPVHFKLPIKKQKDTYRIFVLGASAAMGDPAPSYGYSRMLERLLQNRYDNVDIKVTNLSMAAINSNVLLPIIRDCKKLEPDMFVVYLGNNEVIGPFGPGTVFEPFSSNLSLIRGNIFLKSTKIGQFLSRSVRKLSGGKEDIENWGGINMFLNNRLRHNGEKMKTVYDHFKKNLEDIRDIALDYNSEVVFSTVATNIKDNPPFGSLHKKDFSKEDKRKWDNYYETGKKLESEQKYSKALKAYKKAENIDKNYADLQFRMARCYLRLEKTGKANKHYIKARDYDALKFRADTEINEIIRDVVEGKQNNNVHLLDTEKIFNSESRDGIPGDSLFYDHVHMNFSGNYLIARRLMSKIGKTFNLDSKSKILSKDSLSKILAFTEWDKYRIKNYLYRRLASPAFKNQIGNKETLKEMEIKITNQTKSFKDENTLEETFDRYENSVRKNKNDWILRRNYGRFLLQGLNKPFKAINEFRKVLEEIPYDHVSSKNLGQAYARERYFDIGIKYLKRAINIKPSYRIAKMSLAKIYGSYGKYNKSINLFIKIGADDKTIAKAFNSYGEYLVLQDSIKKGIKQLKKAIEYNPEFSKSYLKISNAYLDKNNTDSAEVYLKRAINKNPDFVKGYRRLASLSQKVGNLEKAIKYFKKALNIDPQQPDVENALGVIYSSELEEHKKGIEHFKKALSINPDFALARNNLAGALSNLGKYDEMVDQLKKALDSNPKNPKIHNNLGGALLKIDKVDEAISHFKKALEIDPNYASAEKNLEKAKNSIKEEGSMN